MSSFEPASAGPRWQIRRPEAQFPAELEQWQGTDDDSRGVAVRRSPSQRAGDWPYAIATTILLLMAVFQNFYRLSLAPVLFDEPLYAQMGWKYAHWGSLPPGERVSELSNFDHPPLAKMLFGAAEVVVGHQSITASRAVAAICTVLAAVVIAVWLAHAANRWVGLLAGGLLALIPMSLYPSVTRFGRAAMLDPVAELFMVVSLVLGWMWFRTSGWRSWVFAGATGVSVGLASASKENGFLGVVFPVLLGLGMAALRRDQLVSRVVQAVGAVVLAVGSFVACYLPFGDPSGRIRYLIKFQSSHSSGGHLVGFAGRVSAHPPWWTNLWFAGHGLGVTLAWALSLTALAAILIRRDWLVAWCVAALIGPFVFHCLLAGVMLPFYWIMWTPAFLVLSALGTWEFVLMARNDHSLGIRAVSGLTAAVAALAILAPTVSGLARVAQLEPVGARAVPGIRASLGLHGTLVIAGMSAPEVTPFFPTTSLTTDIPKNLSSVDTVLLGQPRCRTLVPPQVRALIDTNVKSGALRLARTDRLLRVYVGVAPLQAPSQTQIAQEPRGRLTDNC